MQKILTTTFLAVISLLLGFYVLLLSLDLPGRYSSEDIEFRSNWLINRLSDLPSPNRMIDSRHVEFTGEWALVTYSMASAALTNIAMDHPNRAKEFSGYIARWIEWCLTKQAYLFDEQAWGEDPLLDHVIEKDEGHIGYYGHFNFMLGCYAILNNDGRFKDFHGKISEAIARRMKKYPHRHIETYPYQNYPPDNAVAAASLRLFDKVNGDKYAVLIKEWIEQSRRLEVEPFGLIAFQIDTATGKPMQEARGSNNAWNTFYLSFVDDNYARSQYEKLRPMVRSVFGFAAVREYPQGNYFKSDRDTGPVVFGFGASPTAFMVAGATRWGDGKLQKGLLRSIEIFGCSVTQGKSRHYSSAPVVGDAIMLAMKTMRPWRRLW